MSRKCPSRHKLNAIAAGCSLFLPFVAMPAWADADSSASPGAADSKQESLVVTGSHIRRTSKETPSPVQSISSEDLKQSGYTSLSDVLHDVTANNMGSLTQANPGAFAAGGSGISLRGLTVGATLVLIDGHRMASYPMPDDGERDFVDISSIPFDAIDHIDVLKDGASAVYGSDAMAGVVNVVLKKSFKGRTLSIEGGESGHGDGATEHASFTAGWGDLSKDGQDGYVAVEYRHQNSILLTKRSYLANANWTPYGGVDLTPQNGAATDANGDTFAACPACGPANTHYTIQPQTENLNVLGRFNKALSDNWQLSLEGSVFSSKATQEGVYNAVSTSGIKSFNFQPGSGASPYSPQNFPYQVTLPANYPGNTSGAPSALAFNFPDVGPQTQKSNTQSYRFVAELNGNIGAWDVESSVGVTRVQTKLDNLNYLSIPNLQAALNNLSYSVTGANSPAVLSQIAPSASSTSTNDLDFLSVHGTYEITQLAGGPLALGTGIDIVHRKLNEQFPYSFASGQQYSPIYSFAIGQQNVSAGFVELVAPITREFDVEAALRTDHYNTYGSSTTPKIGFKYTPMKELLLRGTYSEGFRAPNPAEMGNSGSTSGVLNFVYDPVLCPNGTPLAPQDAQYCNINPPEEQLSNPHLKPEKSKSYTLGFVLEPVSWFNTSFDYYNIDLSNQIISVGLLGQTQWSNPSAYGAIVYRGPANPGDPVGPIVYETYPFINASKTRTSGFDVDMQFKFKLPGWGKLNSDLQLTRMTKFDMTFGGNTYALAGTHGPSFISGDTGAPQTRAQETLTWNYGPMEIAGTLNYVSSLSVTDPSAGINTCGAALSAEFPQGSPSAGNPPGQFCRVGSFTEFNLQGRYEWNKNLSFHASVTNLFDRKAPLDLQTFGSAGNGAPSGGAA
ncbi:MAG: TonB-dependent receptor, partial [Burkholderiales bacterium]|nr:TonB-dependent receptor [Burkholderiales bacterium]